MKRMTLLMMLLLAACSAARTPASRAESTPAAERAPAANEPAATDEEPVQPQEDERPGFQAERWGLTMPSSYSRELKLLFIEQSFRHEARFLNENLKRDKGLAYQGFFADAQRGWTQPTSIWSDDVKRRVRPMYGLFATEAASITTQEEFLAQGYDVIVLGDVSTEHRHWKPEYFRWLEAWVKRGGGLILLSGQHNNPRAYAADTSFKSLCPVVPFADKDDETVVNRNTEKYFALTDVGRAHPLLRMVEELERNNELWGAETDGKFAPGELHGIYWYAPVMSVKADANVLARVGKAGESTADTAPLIVTREHGKGRVLWLGTDDMHYWRQWVGEHYFYRFWQNAIRWVARDPGK